MTPAEKLWKLLGHAKVDARPEGLDLDYGYWFLRHHRVEESDALSLLCNAASEILPKRLVRVDYHHTYGWYAMHGTWDSDGFPTRPEALIAGLEHIIGEEASDGN